MRWKKRNVTLHGASRLFMSHFVYKHSWSDVNKHPMSIDDKCAYGVFVTTQHNWTDEKNNSATEIHAHNLYRLNWKWCSENENLASVNGQRSFKIVNVWSTIFGIWTSKANSVNKKMLITIMSNRMIEITAKISSDYI